MSKLKVLDLFSGIGGFSLGLERTGGFETIQFCEIDPYCQKVLRKHWPEVPIHDDIKTLHEGRRADVVTAGFPCQAYSTASRGRANAECLWMEALAIITSSMPRYVVAENVLGLGLTGADLISGDLEAAGYTVGTYRLDTALPGRHRGRHRFFFVAYPNFYGEPRFPLDAEMAGIRRVSAPSEADIARLVGMDDGLSGNLDPNRSRRLKALGNSICPHIAELIGHAILAVEGAEG